MITKEEKEFISFVEKNKNLGYGWMMQTISDIWRKQDSMGALSVGHPYGFLEEMRKFATGK